MDKKRNKRLLWQIPFLLLLIVGTVWVIRNQRDIPYQTDEGFVFGTNYKITYQHSENLRKEIETQMKKVDAALSMFNEQSVISQVNQGRYVVEENEIGKMFLDVFKNAMQISKETDGAFDITVAPLVNAWGFGFKSGSMPTDAQVDSIRKFVGYDKIQYVNEGGKQGIKKSDPRVMLDCSAIAKGYGCDVVAAFLEKEGITNYMVMIGGEVVTKGINPSRLPWRIGVTKPEDDTLGLRPENQTILNVTDKAMATSGNYRNFYYKGGKKYAHTIDPASGRPVQHSLLSATVLADNCATADAYATSFMVMGIERAKEVLKRHPELMVYFIYTDEKGELAVWFSPSLQEKISND